MPEGDYHMQAGKEQPVWRKDEAGELFKRIFENTFTSKSKSNPLHDVEIEMVSHMGNTTGVSPSPGSRHQIDNGKRSVLRLKISLAVQLFACLRSAFTGKLKERHQFAPHFNVDTMVM